MRIPTFALAAVIAPLGCGAPDYGDPGPSAAQIQYAACRSLGGALIVLTVDDRSVGADLRAGVGAAVRALASHFLPIPGLGDPAMWQAVDIQFLLAPPSSDALIGPADDPRLAWTTVSPAATDVDALVAGVEEHLSASTLAGASFRPLERAKSVMTLVAGARAPNGPAEARVAADVAGRRWLAAGASIVAATDDESSDPVASYVLGDTSEPFYLYGHAVTPDGVPTPRLDEWKRSNDGALLDGCYETPPTPFQLFDAVCVDFRFVCDGRPIRQSLPGVGACDIQVVVREPRGCVASRSWADPKSGPSTDASGRQICDVLPVAPAAMNGCIHDLSCPDCGSGWCITQVPLYPCPAGEMPRNLRLVGGAMPDDGCVFATCNEAK